MYVPKRSLVLAFALLISSLPLTANAAGFAISPNGLADGALMPADMGYDKPDSTNRPCGGTNKAPGFTWVNPPDKTQSFAILELDPDGQRGAGAKHWVLYNIPASATGISTAEIAAGKYTPGRGIADVVGYRGPCPAIGDAPHHYVFTLYALDAPPALPAGLDRDGLLAAMNGHVLAATTTVLRFQRQ
jgi:Raf kinase inhibitor-like YbhB/YbcL family protein